MPVDSQGEWEHVEGVEQGAERWNVLSEIERSYERGDGVSRRNWSSEL